MRTEKEVRGVAENLWLKAGNKCLRRAIELLDDKTAPAEETARAVQELILSAVAMDLLNLLWEVKGKFYE